MKKLILFLSLILLFIPSIIYADNNYDKVKFAACIDGDTAKFILNDELITVRFLAIDTPEISGKNKEYYGEVASNYTCNRLKRANTIKLEYDSNSDKYDKYNRVLGWVFIDDILLQQELIAKGYAKVAYLYGNYKYTDILKKYELEAKDNKLGIWNNNINFYYLEMIFGLLIIVFAYFVQKKVKRRKLYGIFKKISKRT